MEAIEVSPVLIGALQDLFTRSFYSAAGYVFESQPYAVREDADLLDLLSSLRGEDRRHAMLLGDLLESFDQVPQPGPFPYWYRDLNFLSVPFLSSFVAEALQEDVRRYESVLARWPGESAKGLRVLETIVGEKRAQAATVLGASKAALEREAQGYREKIDARRKARATRLAQEKAAKAAAAKKAAAPGAAAAPAAGAKLSPKERARLAVMAARGQAPGAAAAAAPAVDLSSLPDPDEAGIPPKEKAKRQMMRMRAAKGGAAPAAPAADLPDPDEPGIPPKEKAKRQMMRMRAAKAGGGAPAAAAAPPPPPAEEDLDPDEPGISPKEKAKRKVARMRKQKGA